MMKVLGKYRLPSISANRIIVAKPSMISPQPFCPSSVLEQSCVRRDLNRTGNPANNREEDPGASKADNRAEGPEVNKADN